MVVWPQASVWSWEVLLSTWRKRVLEQPELSSWTTSDAEGPVHHRPVRWARAAVVVAVFTAASAMAFTGGPIAEPIEPQAWCDRPLMVTSDHASFAEQRQRKERERERWRFGRAFAVLTVLGLGAVSATLRGFVTRRAKRP